MSDGQIFVEPVLFMRPWMSSERAARGPQWLWGEASINYVKGAEEGKPEFLKIIWGLIMGTMEKVRRKDGK